MMIDVDYPSCHRVLYEISGDPGEPIALLTPLGWTYIGSVECGNTPNISFDTYFQIDSEQEHAIIKL
jgi:hypothetical protein